MAKKEDYTIQFTGLAIGRNNFEYKIEDSFFEELEYSEIKRGSITTKVVVDKQQTMLVVTLAIKGFVNTECDRCGEAFDMPVEGTQQLIYKLHNADFVDEDELIYLTNSDSEIKLKHKIYEFIMLSLPAKRVHPDNAKGESTCNKEALALLNKYVSAEKEQQQTDPRWDVLKKIINN